MAIPLPSQCQTLDPVLWNGTDNCLPDQQKPWNLAGWLPQACWHKTMKNLIACMHFLFMTKIIRTFSKDPWRYNFLLVIYIVKDLIWTILKGILSIFRFLHTIRFQIFGRIGQILFYPNKLVLWSEVTYLKYTTLYWFKAKDPLKPPLCVTQSLTDLLGMLIMNGVSERSVKYRTLVHADEFNAGLLWEWAISVREQRRLFTLVVF